MKNIIKSIIAIGIFGISITGCKKDCPEGMHKRKLPDGTVICVPNDL